jgi:hypothetical protein
MTFVPNITPISGLPLFEVIRIVYIQSDTLDDNPTPIVTVDPKVARRAILPPPLVLQHVYASL